jgi:hypothetical protein
LWANYDLAGRHVVCLGDHDLTSIALTLASPDVRVTVVDIDERIIAYITRLAAAWDLPIGCAFADLRVELPPSLTGSADLVFTDPPYTPAGIELFLARGVAALRRGAGSRLLFCYSHNERQPARGVEVQNVVSGLQLSIEAMLPRFNAFRGAESIGSHSALWVCQPTGNAWPAAQRRTHAVAIYTRGRQAEETAGQPGEPVLARLRAHAGPDAGARPAAPLDPRDAARPAAPLDPRDAAVVQEVGTRDAALSLDTLLGTEPPAGQGGLVRPGALLLADLTEVHHSYAYRLLLRGLPVDRGAIAVSGRPGWLDPDGPGQEVWRLVAACYVVHLDRWTDDTIVVDATARPAEEVPDDLRVARYVLDHPRARLAGAWREALVAGARRQGRSLSKNEARRLVAEVVDPRTIADRYLCELPDGVLQTVAGALVTPGPAVPHPEPAAR